MKQHGRKSAEARLTVIKGDFGRERPKPPDDLTAEQAAIWERITRDEPLDYFATAATQNMLKQYCRECVEIERISGLLNEFQTSWVKSRDGSERYLTLLKMRTLATRSATSLATKLRITNQSRYRAERASTASLNTAKGIKPWEL